MNDRQVEWRTDLRKAITDDDGRSARRVLSADFDGEQDDVLAALASEAATGSRLGLELLIEFLDTHRIARTAVRRFLLDESAIDDVTQDTLVAVAASISSFRGDAKVRSWLYQIARNRVTDHLRRQRPTVALEERRHGAAMRVSSVLATRQTVHQLLDRLPDDYRTAVTMRDIELLPYADVAERLGRNINTVKSHVARGRALLATMLDEDAIL